MPANLRPPWTTALESHEGTEAQAGKNQCTLTFTYDCVAWSREMYHTGPIICWVDDDDFYDPILHDPF